MLAKIGKPFDDPDWIYEIKWDGTRALTFVEADRFWMFNRNRNAVHERYPELGELAALPSGTVIDGEITVLVDGKPSFPGMLKREQARDERRFAALARTLPAVYVAFDLLYRNGEPILDWPLTDRREALREILEALGLDPGRASPGAAGRIIFSDGIVGQGRDYFEEAVRRELEGIVAKRLASPYRPGKRTDSWLKIKRTQHVYAAILGFLPDGERDFRSLVIGLDADGELVPAGRVGSGLNDSVRAELHPLLRDRVVDEPVIPIRAGSEPTLWVEPGLFCEVKFLERTADGQLRAPVFVRLISE